VSDVVFTVDPGIHHLGVAVFCHGKLSSAGLVEASPTGGSRLLAASAALAASETSALCADPPAICGLSAASRAVIELPEVYQLRGQKGRQSDIRDLAVVAGAIGAVFDRLGVPVEFVEPKAWKGQIPKDVGVRQFKHILTGDETSRVLEPRKALSHNVWDAVGIGLWAAGRFGRRLYVR